jgi:hypothetical protein
MPAASARREEHAWPPKISHVTSTIEHKVEMTVRYFSIEQRKDERFLATLRPHNATAPTRV